MTAHDWYVDNRLAFATRMLEGKEESVFANHVSRCIDCRAAVAQLERDLTWLPMGVAPVPLRPGLTHDLMHGVLHQRRTRWWQWTPALAAAAALVVALAVWTETASRDRRAAERAGSAPGTAARHRGLALAILGAERVLQETVRGPGYKGGFLLFYDQDTERWNVVVHDLPPARAGEEYRLWFVTDRGLLPDRNCGRTAGGPRS